MKKVRPFYLVILVILFSIFGLLIYLAYFNKHQVSEESLAEYKNLKFKHGLMQKVLKQASVESKQGNYLKSAILYIQLASLEDALGEKASTKPTISETMALHALTMAKINGQYNGEFNYQAFLDAKYKQLDNNKTPNQEASSNSAPPRH